MFQGVLSIWGLKNAEEGICAVVIMDCEYSSGGSIAHLTYYATLVGSVVSTVEWAY